MFATGFFGVPGSSRGKFTVHVVTDGGRPLCGWRPRKEMEFQWCANGIQYSCIECDRCRDKAQRIMRIVDGRK